MSGPPEGFAVFILTNGRPKNVQTYQTLRRSGYTGPIYLLVDDLDQTLPEYRKLYGEQVVVFDKRAEAEACDQADTFGDLCSIIYARNASFAVAEDLGLTHFIQLDDDYSMFEYRFTDTLQYTYQPHLDSVPCIRNLDLIFGLLRDFYEESGAHAVAMAQGGDFIGGMGSAKAKAPKLLRKCMNSFLCSPARPFKWVGRLNEDVNTYTRLGSVGVLLLSTNQVSLVQGETQKTPGGMSEMYRATGTYVKSFYTLLYHPSSVHIRMMRSKNSRLHHEVKWRCTVPKILRESLQKEVAA